eukprot:7481929-Pyramimonas_sp.AAC.1
MGTMVDGYLPVPDKRSSSDTQVEEGSVHEPTETSERAGGCKIVRGSIEGCGQCGYILLGKACVTTWVLVTEFVGMGEDGSELESLKNNFYSPCLI